MKSSFRTLLLLLTTLSFFAGSAMATDRLRLLIVDGQNNHRWEVTTPILEQLFESSGRFAVEVATSPPKRQDMNRFRPKFADYDLVVSNYNGDRWPRATEQALHSFVLGGGGFVVVHAADNAFPDWAEYNQMCGLGGWEGRSEKSGPYVYVREGKLVRDDSPGEGGNHGEQHEFLVKTFAPNHPIMRGIPQQWLHTKDELYEKLRGPAEGLEVLATAFADPQHGGTGRDEPMLMALSTGQGRIFHTVLGHEDYSMRCVGFATTLLRGAEWAATGRVTLPVPADFPTAQQTSPIVVGPEQAPKR